MTTEDIQKFKILASEERFRAGLRWLADFDRVSWGEVRDFVSSFVIPGEEFRAFLAIARKNQENGGKRPGDIPGLADELRIEMARKWCSLDPLSIVGASVPPLSEGDSFPWSLLSPAYFLGPFSGDGGYLTITGRPRSGKTGIACLLGEIWLDEHPGTQVLTNVPLDGKILSGLRPITGMLDLLDGVADALEAERKWLWILDEGGLVWLRAEAMKTSSRGLEKFARIVPKLQGSLIYVEQRIEGVPSVLRDFAQSHFFCDRPGFALADLPGNRTTVRSIPRPKRFRYRSEETGFFESDANVETLLSHLPERSGKTQAERIRAFVKNARLKSEAPHDPRSGRFLPKAVGGAVAPPSEDAHRTDNP